MKNTILRLTVGTAVLAGMIGLAQAQGVCRGCTANGWSQQGSGQGGYIVGSVAGSGGANWGQGRISERNSWAGSNTNNSGDLAMTGSDSGGKWKFKGKSSASSGAGNYIETTGRNAAGTASVSASGAAGGVKYGVRQGGSNQNWQSRSRRP